MSTTTRVPKDASIRRVSAAGAVAHVPLPLSVEVGCDGGISCGELTVVARELREERPRECGPRAAQILVALEGFDVERLAFEVAGVHRVDLKLLARLAAQRIELGPDAGELIEADRGIREQRQHIAAHAILIDLEALRLRLRRPGPQGP